MPLRNIPSLGIGHSGLYAADIPALYTLYDKFTTALAAGSVNGTLAEPVGGARTVTDTESKLTISSGLLTFAGGKASPANGDPGIWWGTAITRSSGQVLLAKFTPTATDTYGPVIGFARSPAANVWDASVQRRINNELHLRITSSAFGYVALILENVEYTVAIVLRSVGFFVFIKGGVLYPYWEMVYPYPLISAATLYAGVENYNAVFTADNIRVPKRLFIPVPLQSDGFSAATTDGAGNAEANGPVGSVWTGATWGVAGGAVTNAPTIEDSEKVANGAFASNINSWSNASTPPATISWNAGGWMDLYAATGINDARAYQAITTVVGNWYSSSVDLSGGGFGFGTANNISDIASRGASVPCVLTWKAVGTTTFVRLTNSVNETTYTADNVSVKPLTLSTLFRSLAHSSANVVADVAVTLTAGTQAGLVVNLDSAATPANFVIAYHDGTNAKLDKCVAGVYTNMISAAATYSAGAVIRVVKDGTAYRLFYNNAAVGSVTTIADAGIVSNTLHGLFSTYSANSFDNFCVWARGNEGQYSGLDSL